MLKGVIFDLDGVLLKFNLDSKKIKEEIISFFVENGLEKGMFTPKDTFSSIKEGVKEYFLGKGKEEEWIDDLLKKGEEIAVKHEIEAAKTTDLLPDVKEVLMTLRAKGLKLAVFTYNNSEAAKIALEKTGIIDYFDVILARDNVPKPKPNPEHLKVVLQSMDINPEEAVVVGDTEMDIKPCKALGVKVVSVTTGIRTEEELKKYEPDFIISGLKKLPALIESKL
ncbi:MAG: HAD family hydrolase [Candidatus Methanomethylicaceae archaeon]|nr:HAD family hydrolase [Candidatus Verstraetearchaeota archaeon]